jgi:hypothetical protein
MTFFRDPKRLLATLIAGVAGAIVLLDFARAAPGVGGLASYLVEWAAVLTALALLVGLINVAFSHAARVFRRDADWIYSLVLLLAMFTVIIVGLAGPPGVNLAEEPLRRLFEAVYVPLAGSLLALLAFFSLSAILRTVRERNVPALVIVVVALVVLILGLPPVAALPLVGAALGWFNEYVTLAGARGLLLGAAIGTLVASVRVLLGFDQPYLDR